MDITRLNQEGMEVSGLSLGTWAFSGAAVWGRCDEEAACETVDRALDEGINLFDTASAYGDGAAEVLLGKALSGKRDRALVATKVYSDRLDRQGVISSCEESLKRLGMDYIDLFQIHWPNPEIPVDETFEAFEKLKRDGKVRAVGVCNHGLKAMEQVAGKGVVMNQMPYSLVWRLAEYHVSPVMEENGIYLWAYSPLGQGLLTGKYRSLEDVPMHRRTTRIYNSKWGQGVHTDGGFEAEVFGFLAELGALCEESGHTMAEMAFAFLKSRKNVGSILAGARTARQLMENVQAYNRKVPQDVILRLEELSAELKSKMGTNADMWQNCNGGKGRFY